MTSTEQLPSELAWAAKHGGVPGLLFPWTGPDGTRNWQLRPDNPIVCGDSEEPRKYVQGRDVRLLNVLGDPASASEVWLVEGTKQALAAAAYAPDNVAVVAIPGCEGAVKDGLLLPGLADLIDGRPCVVWMDADIASNRNVWSASERLGPALQAEAGSTVRYDPTQDWGPVDTWPEHLFASGFCTCTRSVKADFTRWR